jgi:hypothetical protein
MSADKTPYTPEPANDELDWTPEIRDGEVWLVGDRDLRNLGPKEAVFTKWAEMGENVVPVDFGKDRNEHERHLARLLGMVDEHHAAIRNDPVQFLKAAEQEIVAMRMEMERLQDTMFQRFDLTPFSEPPQDIRFETVMVTREDYDRFKACEAIVESWRVKGYIP